MPFPGSDFSGVFPRKTWILLFLAGILSASGSRADASGPPIHVATEVADPFFAFLVGMVDSLADRSFEADDILMCVQAAGGSRLPVQRVRRIRSRLCGISPRAQMSLEFHETLKAPIPYSILGYNPGSIRASEKLRFLFWPLGDRSFWFPSGDAGARKLEVEDLQLLMLKDGFLKIDVDGWIDRLLGGKLDDVEITGLLLFRKDGRRYGLAFGYTPDGKGQTGAFDLQGDEVLFPPPREFLLLGRKMRSLGENRLKLAGR